MKKVIFLIAFLALFLPHTAKAWYFSPSSTLFNLGDVVTLHTQYSDWNTTNCTTNTVIGWSISFYSNPASNKTSSALSTWGDPDSVVGSKYFLISTSTVGWRDVAEKFTVSNTWSQDIDATSTGTATVGNYFWNKSSGGNLGVLTCKLPLGSTAYKFLTSASNSKNSGITQWITSAPSGSVSNTTSTSYVNTTSTEYIEDMSYAVPGGILIFLIVILVCLSLFKR